VIALGPLLPAVLLGAGVGAGLWALVVGFRPPRPSLAAVLARLDPLPPPPPMLAATDLGWVGQAGRPLARLLAAAGLPRGTVRRDLAVMERSVQRHLAEQAILALTGLFLPSAATLVLAAGGIKTGWMPPLWAGLALAATAGLGADAVVRAQAVRRRRDVRYALSAFLDLVVVSLAGGSGVDGALTDATSVGNGWAFTQIRRALEIAQLSRTTAWATLGRLGEELDVPELVEFAAAVGLAGTEGAKVRASLAAKAAALRAHELSEAEGEAASATERMSLPVVLLFAGFLIFIGYPALAAVLGGF